MYRRFFFTQILILLSVTLFSQVGSEVYGFLQLAPNSRVATQGGLIASLPDADVSAAILNPALLSDKTDDNISINYINYFTDVNYASVAYGKNIKSSMFGAALIYMDYGSFAGTTETNESTGQFSAKEYALHLMYAKQVDKNLQAGLTIKPIYSAFDTYTSFGLGVDLGLNYYSQEKGFSAGLAIQNIGRQLSSYNNTIEPMPFNTVLTATKKFSHAPFRIVLTAHHLHMWDLSSYDNILDRDLDGALIPNDISFGDMLMRHLIIGTELVFSKNFYVGISYNHRRAAELGVDDVRTMAGFSFGGGIKVSKFSIGFSAAEYQKGIVSYQVSLNTNLNSFKK